MAKCQTKIKLKQLPEKNILPSSTADRKLGAYEKFVLSIHPQA